MADHKNCLPFSKDSIILDVNRVLDSCRDKDCFEDVKVIIGQCGREIIEKTTNLRVKCAEVVWTGLDVEPVRFNKGFYSISIKYYVKITFEACITPGKISEFEGLAVCDKKVILYGGEGNVNIFRSGENSDFCTCPTFSEVKSTNLPFAVCEVTDPIALNMRVTGRDERRSHCCCCVDEVPDHVHRCFCGKLLNSDDTCRKELLITLGFFSIVRIERPGQYLVQGMESCIPDKECMCKEIDPCSVFKHMEFPVEEFCTGPQPKKPNRKDTGCGCK